MSHKNRLRVVLLASALLGMVVVASPIVHAATFVVINNDGAGEGFNDPTAAAPVGGNTGTTVGAQRLIAFQAAADKWGTLLSSSVTIRVGAQFNPLTCTATSAVLGSAGATNFFRDFSGAPVAGTWYAVALANALHGSDLDAGDDISAQFNSNIGTPGCLTTSGWYYGLDGAAPSNRIDFYTVLLHELGHGLGFLTIVDLATGAKALGFNDAYMRFLENHGASPPDYPSMSNAQRVTASTATGNLHWTGANVRAASGVLSAGKVGDHVRMFAPNPQQPGSSVSHWDTALTPDQLMEPSYTSPLHNPNLELPLFQDIGWTLLGPPPPPPGGSPVIQDYTCGAPRLGDFNADLRGDLVWRQNVSGSVAVWLMNGATILTGPVIATVPVDWHISGVTDFNADGKGDLLWRHTDGSVAIWLMNGTSIVSGPVIATVPPDWRIAGVGDFNGDGRGDILWRHRDGSVAIWFMNGTSIVSGPVFASVPPDWHIVGVGDFNGDGRADIVWRHSTGAVAIWLMNGTTILSGPVIATVPSDWRIAGVGDFNGDGRADLVWRHTDGSVAIWLMNGTSIVSGPVIASVPGDWQISGVADFNGDGKADIVWLQNSGSTAIWFMNGTTIVSGPVIATVPVDWGIVFNRNEPPPNCN